MCFGVCFMCVVIFVVGFGVCFVCVFVCVLCVCCVCDFVCHCYVFPCDFGVFVRAFL